MSKELEYVEELKLRYKEENEIEKIKKICVYNKVYILMEVLK